MRRVLFAVVMVAALLVPASSAFAQDGICPYDGPQADGWWLLGEIWWTPDWLAAPTDPLLGGDPDCWSWFPGERVDGYMTRLSTIGGWPLLQAPIMGDWWVTLPASEQRRMTYEFEGDMWKYANDWGGYYAQFMLPRDEVWFPCSYPYKWKCNYQVNINTFEFHSPAAMAYECVLQGLALVCLDWPWYFDDGVTVTQAAPYDTISPVVIDIWNPDVPFPFGYEFELEIAGYFWKWTDLKDPWYPVICPGPGCVLP
jgi:hypothetical protein